MNPTDKAWHDNCSAKSQALKVSKTARRLESHRDVLLAALRRRDSTVTRVKITRSGVYVWRLSKLCTWVMTRGKATSYIQDHRGNSHLTW